MKKYIPLILVSVFSSLFTLGAMYIITKKTAGSFSSSDNSGFTSVDYASYSTPPPNFIPAADKTTNAVVSVKQFSSGSSRGMDLSDFFFGFGTPQQPKNEPTGLGSGVIISKDGYIVTNNHVIQGAEKVEVTLNNQKTYPATIIGTDPNTDIALLKIEADNLTFLNFYNSDNVQVGEWVLAVGNPFGLTSTVTAGIISAKGRSLDLLRRNSDNPIESFLQTDAVINPGNSGGALVNENGDLIGINTAISSHTGSYEGYGFAVPSNLAKKIVEDIKNYGRVQRGYLGVNILDLANESAVSAHNQRYKTNYKTGSGLLIIGLTDDGGAISAGLEEGDIITEIDGKSVKNFSGLSIAVGSKRPGDKISVYVLRNGKPKEYAVTLRDSDGKTAIRSKSDLTGSEKIGAKFQPLTKQEKDDYALESGVVVTKLDNTSKLRSLGIQEGFIILQIDNVPINSQSDVDKVLKNKKGTASIQFVDPYGRVYRRGIPIE